MYLLTGLELSLVCATQELELKTTFPRPPFSQLRLTTNGWLRQQTFISHGSRSCEWKIKVAVDLVSGKAPLPSLQLATFLSSPQEARKERQTSQFLLTMTPIWSCGPILMTLSKSNYFPKVLPLNIITLGLGIQHIILLLFLRGEKIQSIAS